MKITIIHTDSKRRIQIRLSERPTNGLSTLFKRFPPGTVMKRRNRKIDVSKIKCQLNEVFSDGDIVKAVYSPVLRTRRLWNGVKRSTDPCMITLDTVEPRAKMACGHAISPQALYDFCRSELEKGSYRITCPYVKTIKGETCGYMWGEKAITLSAAMSQTEKILFQKTIGKNRIKKQEMESKNVYPDDIMISLLHNSPKLYRHNVLRLRACPKCWSIIEHTEGCLSMTCRYPSCGFRFCFRCLDGYTAGIDHNRCLLATLQFTSD